MIVVPQVRQGNKSSELGAESGREYASERASSAKQPLGLIAHRLPLSWLCTFVYMSVCTLALTHMLMLAHTRSHTHTH